MPKENINNPRNILSLFFFLPKTTTTTTNLDRFIITNCFSTIFNIIFPIYSWLIQLKFKTYITRRVFYRIFSSFRISSLISYEGNILLSPFVLFFVQINFNFLLLLLSPLVSRQIMIIFSLTSLSVFVFECWWWIIINEKSIDFG